MYGGPHGGPGNYGPPGPMEPPGCNDIGVQGMMDGGSWSHGGPGGPGGAGWTRGTRGSWRNRRPPRSGLQQRRHDDGAPWATITWGASGATHPCASVTIGTWVMGGTKGAPSYGCASTSWRATASKRTCAASCIPSRGAQTSTNATERIFSSATFIHSTQVGASSVK